MFNFLIFKPLPLLLTDYFIPKLFFLPRLAIAASEGVKIILPLINQDYGSTGSDWVGNFNDLIRHRFQISDYAAAHVTVDWFTNTTIRNDFKKIIKYVLNRKNTKNGRVYGSDDTFLAFETGNELNWASYTPISVNDNSTIINTNNDNSKIRDTSSNKDDGNDNGPEPESDTVNFITYKISHSRPAPSNWTIDIARYIKSLAPRIMVMDGSFARTTVAADAWPQETLLSPYVDLFSYHLYGDGDALIASSYQAQAEKYNKAAVIGEHGFYSSINSWEEFYERFTGAGSLAWSLRPHSPRSGFITHSEGNNIYSYHIPGWSENSNEFDPLEYNIVKLTYNNCYSALGKKLQPYPIPLAPEPFIVSHEDYDGLSFKGSAWARGYEIWASRHEDSEFFQVAEEVHDNVLAGELFMEIDPHHPTHLLQLQKKTLTKNTHKISGKWKDLKWATTTTVRDQHNKTYHAYKNYMDYSGNLSPLDGSKISTNCSGTLRKTKFKKRSQKSREAWFIIRGLSIDGVPGPFSSPISV
ncbi:family 5 glycoside hydrolase [Phakopsora pachyrhizi]|nr:family 5 glycoside hydrolase [Phakopsora pachyrhizi]